MLPCTRKMRVQRDATYVYGHRGARGKDWSSQQIKVPREVKARHRSNAGHREHYSQYVEATNALNTDREKSNLAPVHVMTFDEWQGTTK